MAMIEYGTKALREMFGKAIRPTIPLSLPEITTEAQKLAGKLSISGVQPKLSMKLENDRLVPVARDGLFILKPQTEGFHQLPQNEYLCMQLGAKFGIRTARSLLLELEDGTPAYLTKRFDRFKNGRRIAKLACEDMHQILGGTDKYSGSHEQIAQVIREYCTFAPLELQRFYELTLMNFALGNGDAHRKNFSLLTDASGTVALSPAYDLVSSRLAIPAEREELALTLQGKRNQLKRTDFKTFAKHIGVAAEYAENRIDTLVQLQAEFDEAIVGSELTDDLRERMRRLVSERLGQL